MFYEVERSIVVLKPKQAFLDWINTALGVSEEGQLTLDSVRIDCNSYLIPEIEEIEEGVNYIDDNFENLFKIELASWTEDESLWPEELSLYLFWEWFDVEISPTLIDLSDDDANQNGDNNDDEDTIH